MRTCSLAVALWLLTPAAAYAEWQIRPFFGFTFGGATTFTYLDDAVAQRHGTFGVSGGWLGEIFGFEGDFGRGLGWAGDGEILRAGGVTTLTGNVVIALPRQLAGYGLRPYFVGGGGLVHVDFLGDFGAALINRTLPAISLGGGVTGFLTDRIGLNWDVRRVSTLRGEGETLGNSIGDEELSFWRATMAVAVRY